MSMPEFELPEAKTPSRKSGTSCILRRPFSILLRYAHTTNSAADRKSTRLNSSHLVISYAVFCLKKKNQHPRHTNPCTLHPLLFLSTYHYARVGDIECVTRLFASASD